MRCSCPLCRVGSDHTWLVLALCGVVAVSVVGWVCIQVGKPVLVASTAVVASVVCTGVVRAVVGAVKAGGGGSGSTAAWSARRVGQGVRSSPPSDVGEAEAPVVQGQSGHAQTGRPTEDSASPARGSVSGTSETAGEGRGPVQGGTVRESRDSSLDLPSPVDELAARRTKKERAA